MSLIMNDATLQSKHPRPLNESTMSKEELRKFAESVKAKEPDVVIQEKGDDVIIKRVLKD